MRQNMESCSQPASIAKPWRKGNWVEGEGESANGELDDSEDINGVYAEDLFDMGSRY